LERIARDKHSSLLRKFVNYGQKKFYNIGHRKKMCFRGRCEYPSVEAIKGVLKAGLLQARTTHYTDRLTTVSLPERELKL
jgi:hypothetical protein